MGANFDQSRTAKIKQSNVTLEQALQCPDREGLLVGILSFYVRPDCCASIVTALIFFSQTSWNLVHVYIGLLFPSEVKQFLAVFRLGDPILMIGQAARAIPERIANRLRVLNLP